MNKFYSRLHVTAFNGWKLNSTLKKKMYLNKCFHLNGKASPRKPSAILTTETALYISLVFKRLLSVLVGLQTTHSRLITFILLLNRSKVHSFACDGILLSCKQSRGIILIYHFYFLLLTAQESLLSWMHRCAQCALSNLCVGIY